MGHEREVYDMRRFGMAVMIGAIVWVPFGARGISIIPADPEEVAKGVEEHFQYPPEEALRPPRPWPAWRAGGSVEAALTAGGTSSQWDPTILVRCHCLGQQWKYCLSTLLSRSLSLSAP